MAVLCARIIGEMKKGQSADESSTAAVSEEAYAPSEAPAEEQAGEDGAEVAEGAGETGEIAETVPEAAPEAAPEAFPELVPEAAPEGAENPAPEGTPEEAPVAEESAPAEDFGHFLNDPIVFSFDDYSNDIWNGAYSLPDGSRREALLPVMIDSGDGSRILADGYRKIVCVAESEGELLPYALTGDTADDNAILCYSSFIEVKDLLASSGWMEDEGDGGMDEGMLTALGNIPLATEKLVYIGEKDGYHLFRYGSDPSTDLYELYDLFSGFAYEGDSVEYVLIL